jgi:hypothetical protein
MAGALELPFGAENLFGCRACFVLARLDLLAKLPRFSGCRLEEAVVLRALFGNAGQLGAGLLELDSGGGDARFEFADALGVAALAGSRALKLDGGLVGAVLRLVAFAIE